jgi:hypothetical protein
MCDTDINYINNQEHIFVKLLLICFNHFLRLLRVSMLELDVVVTSF